MATIEVVYSFLVAFSYKSKDWTSATLTDAYEKPYETHVNSSLNLWKIANMMLHYSKLAMFGVALILQIVSVAGIANDINLLVWDWSIFVAYGSIQILYAVLLGYSYDTAVNKCRQEELTGACGVVTLMDQDWTTFLGMAAFSTSLLSMDTGAWRQGQALGMDDPPLIYTPPPSKETEDQKGTKTLLASL